MLVLSRKSGEKIFIGDDVFITVLAIEAGRVRLGIIAPKDTPVDREEVHEVKKKEREYHAETKRLAAEQGQ